MKLGPGLAWPAAQAMLGLTPKPVGQHGPAREMEGGPASRPAKSTRPPAGPRSAAPSPVPTRTRPRPKAEPYPRDLAPVASPRGRLLLGSSPPHLLSPSLGGPPSPSNHAGDPPRSHHGEAPPPSPSNHGGVARPRQRAWPRLPPTMASVQPGAGGASTELAAPTRSGSSGFARSGARRRRTTRSTREEVCGAPQRWIQGGRTHRWWMQGMPVLQQRIKGGGIP